MTKSSRTILAGECRPEGRVSGTAPRKSLVCAGLTMLMVVIALAPQVHAQEPVVESAQPDALFTSPDPALNANKQVVYHIMKDLLEANHWELADKYLTARYLQHNPQVKSGRDGVVRFFTTVLKAKPAAIPAQMRTKVVSVTAEGDLVVVSTVQTLKDPHDPSKTYTTTWFDMWRIRDGKADEHWDCATKS